MKLQCNSPVTGQEKNASLREWINEQLLSNSFTFTSNGSTVINEVPADIQFYSEISQAKELIKKIIDVLSLSVKNSVTRISAKKYSDIILIHFKENDLADSPYVFEKLIELVPEAEKLRGYLGITSQPNGLMTIVLTLLNYQNQADMSSAEQLAQLISAKRNYITQSEL